MNARITLPAHLSIRVHKSADIMDGTKQCESCFDDFPAWKGDEFCPNCEKESEEEVMEMEQNFKSFYAPA